MEEKLRFVFEYERDVQTISELCGYRGIIACREEGAVGRKASVIRESNGPFRVARQPVARTAGTDGEAIALGLRWREAICWSPR